MFQRTASLSSSMQHLYTQTDKHLCPYCSTGEAAARGGDGVGEVAPRLRSGQTGAPRSSGETSDGQREHCRSSSFEEVAYAKFQLRGESRSFPSAISPEYCRTGVGCSGRSLDRYESEETPRKKARREKHGS